MIERDISSIKNIFHYPENTDVIFRKIKALDREMCIIYMDGMADAVKIEDFIIRALQECKDEETPDSLTDYICKRALQTASLKRTGEYSKIVESVISGGTILLCEGETYALDMDTRGYESRKVNQATNESVVSGSQEGYVENLRTNLTLIHRYCKTPDLIIEMISVGKETTLQVAVAYIKDTVDENALNELRKRLEKIERPSVHGIGQLQQLIEDDPWALFPQMLMTERPDRTAAALTDGQFAVLADCSPYVLIAPCSLFSLMQSSDDAFSRWQYGSYMRVVRFIGMLLALLLPGIYVALISYHTQLIPLELLSSIAETRVNVPFPVLVEVFIMELAFFMINEANLRIPSQVGMSISIIGALVLGQAAVQASIISPILIIVIALSGLGCYCMPNYGMTIALIIYRLSIELCAALLGLFGVLLALFAIICGVCGMKSFGCDFMAPLAPYRPHNPDLLMRMPIFMQRKAMFFSQSKHGCGGSKNA